MADDSKIQGEGDYISSKRFQKEETEFAQSGKVDKAAHEAREALDGPEGAELEKARRETSKGVPKP